MEVKERAREDKGRSREVEKRPERSKEARYSRSKEGQRD